MSRTERLDKIHCKPKNNGSNDHNIYYNCDITFENGRTEGMTVSDLFVQDGDLSNTGLALNSNLVYWNFEEPTECELGDNPFGTNIACR